MTTPLRFNHSIQNTLAGHPHIHIMAFQDYLGKLGCWMARCHVSSKELEIDALPQPVLVMHMGGQTVQYWTADGWSANHSYASQFSILPANSPLRFKFKTQADLFIIGFEPDFLEDTDERQQRNILRHICQKQGFPFALYDEFIVSAVHRLSSMLNPETAVMRKRQKTVLRAMLEELKAHFISPEKAFDSVAAAGSDHRIYKALELIHEQLDNSELLAGLPSKVHLSPSYFRKIFQKVTGMNPHQYITRKRLERAQNLLLHSKTPIALIASECGFYSQSHLTLAFRKEFSTTPKLYRETHG